ncbi:unnamed protein product [Acanthoscelides obtectus]|uniref:PHD-type domain-containing protein n=1 Tax=Acanthoscelides obtectus TaxID=200917 RepID=A0A9P0LJC3_ACAOB|nr:unnamed protein product [Acanthoscelides obtectus]CAK1671030.1 hypothetical protein AOBTE_LOCUS27999 [Acanthoscelides obtectus]
MSPVQKYNLHYYHLLIDGYLDCELSITSSNRILFLVKDIRRRAEVCPWLATGVRCRATKPIHTSIYPRLPPDRTRLKIRPTRTQQTDKRRSRNPSHPADEHGAAFPLDGKEQNQLLQKVELAESTFADDLVLVTGSVGSLQENLNIWNTVLEDNSMKLNKLKTKVMAVSNEKLNMDIRIDNILHRNRFFIYKNYLSSTHVHFADNRDDLKIVKRRIVQSTSQWPQIFYTSIDKIEFPLFRQQCSTTERQLWEDAVRTASVRFNKEVGFFVEKRVKETWRTPSSNGAGSGMSGKNKPPDIERRCEVCDEEIRKGGAKVMCSNVSCGITLHQKCFASIAKVIKLDKAEWLCKNCDEESDSSINTVITSDGDLSRELTTVKHDVQILTDLVNELKRANEILLAKIEQLTVNKSPGVQTPYLIRNISYSQAVSTNVKNETKSVLVITSKSDKETNMDVLKNIKANVNPATEKISISSTKLVKQGMLVKCSNDESLQKLKAIVEEKFSRQYKITTPKSFKPRVLVSDVDKSLDNNDDFIQSLVQNNTFLVDCDIKIITMLKLKYSLSYVIEVDPEIIYYIANLVKCDFRKRKQRCRYHEINIINRI